MHDLILTGARVIDPSQNHDGIIDVGFKDGRVSGFGKDLKRGSTTEVRDLAGYILSPGLIDLHTHVYWGGTSLGIDADDFCRLSGVTTSVDTGSAGPAAYASGATTPAIIVNAPRRYQRSLSNTKIKQAK